jgi:tripartite-type tricarboxylate transporter receptor subunit TctC
MSTLKRVAIFVLCGGTAMAARIECTAQPYPSKPVRLIVPFAPGGGTDMIARTIGTRLSESLGHTVVIDNRAGAGGVIGAEMVANSLPDGYTLLMGTPGPLTINPALLSKMPYTLKEFDPITLATISPFVLTVNTSLRAASVKELIALAKEKPDGLSYGSAGNGSVAHLASEQFKALAGIQLVHVPYKGSIPALTDLLAGRIQIQIENLPVVLPYIRSGKLRALAVGTQKRSALLPDIPTMVEAGVPGYEASTASGVLAPARTPQDRLTKLNRELVKVLQGSDMKERFSTQGLEIVASTPEQYAAHLRQELAQNAKVAKLASIKLD